MQFRVRYFDPVSRRASDALIEASSREAALAILKARGWLLLDLRSSFSGWPRRSNKKLNLGLFCREIRGLLDAGMTIVEALEALSERAVMHPNTLAYQVLMAHVLEGKMLSVALEESGLPFPLILIAGVRASERSGRLAQALSEYMQYDALLTETRRRVINAAIYPGLVVGFGGIVTLFLLGFVVPRFTQIYTDFSGTISPSTKLIMWLGNVVGTNLMVALLLLGLALAAAVYFGRVKNIRDGLLRQFLRISWLRQLAQKFQLARIYRTLVLLLKGGFPLPQSMQMASGLALEPALRFRLARVQAMITEGQPIGASFAAQQLVDEVGERLIVVGERSGSLAQSLDAIAQDLQRSVDTTVDRMTRLLEPILIFAVALMIGAIVVMMYLPIFDLTGGIL